MSKVSVANQDPESLFAAAQEALQAADIAQALSLFSAVVCLDPKHGMANYWLGVLLKSASLERAISHLEIAAARHPDLPDCHVELGAAYSLAGLHERAEASFRMARELTPLYGAAQISIADSFLNTGQTDEAIEACKRGLLVFPNDPLLLRKLADLYSREKRWRDALAIWRLLLETNPDCASSCYAFAQVCVEAGEFDTAAAAFERVLKLRPEMTAARLNLGVVYDRLSHHERALECYQASCRLEPNNSEIHKAIGDACAKLARWSEAEAAWRRAIELRPEYADAWQNLGLGLDRMNRLEEAFECHERVVALRPSDGTAQRYLGMIAQDLGRFALAQQCYNKALSINRHDAEAHWQLFSLLATRGEFPAAWVEHEWRWEIQNRTTPKHGFSKPRWTGEHLAGRTILLHAEQGFGDTIQALRYIPLVQQRGGRILLWVPPELVSLARNISGVAEVFSQLTTDRTFDFELPLMSLPLVFQTTLETIPSEIPYLEPPKETRFVLPEFDPTRLKVGLVWCGSRSQPNDRRPVPFPVLERLLQTPGVEFYSLQCGEAAADLQRFPCGARIIDLSVSLVDFAVTAKALTQLDLLITIDTAIAHLAGALGTRVWTLLSATPDWRWLRDREDCPWYPTMRLFRQTRAGDWTPVVENLIRAVADLVTTQSRSIPARMWLGNALAYHQRGELAEAEWCYEQTLVQCPEQPDALRFLAEICLQRRQWNSAQHWLEKAISAAPDSPHVYNDLGVVCFEQGRFEESLTAYQRAIQLQPEFPDAFYNLGNAFYQLKRLAEAKAAYQSALEQNPALADANYNLGLIAHEHGESAEALSRYRATLQAYPRHVGAWQNLGLTLKEEGHYDEAEECFRNLIELSPTHAQAHVNLASVLLATNQLENAEQLCLEAIGMQGDLAEAWLNLGVARQARGNINGALEAFRSAFAMQPGSADAEYNLAIAELLSGDFQSGWKHYEARWRTSNPIFARTLSLPIWRGESLSGRTLLVHAEQGYGDTIQFARYLPLLLKADVRVTFECPPSLVALMKTLAAEITVVPTGEPTAPCDLQCPLMSLPERLGTDATNIPSNVPYLHPPQRPDIIERCNNSSQTRIGLVWFGSRNQPSDRRPIPFEYVEPLLGLPGLHFYCLQAGEMPNELERYVQFGRVTHVGDLFTDFAATAAALNQMDLIVTVDTASAHLAGALGRRVWVLLPFAPDWRWLLDREDSPWYPTMRLFRQPKPGDWAPVIERVSAELGKFTPH